MPRSKSSAPPPSASVDVPVYVPVDVDVSGRALRLRDVDIGAFLHPKTIAVIGASEQSAKPNTAMTRKFAQWSQQNGFFGDHDKGNRANARNDAESSR